MQSTGEVCSYSFTGSLFMAFVQMNLAGVVARKTIFSTNASVALLSEFKSSIRSPSLQNSVSTSPLLQTRVMAASKSRRSRNFRAFRAIRGGVLIKRELFIGYI